MNESQAEQMSSGGLGIQAQVQALTDHAGVCRRGERLMVRMTGDDRVTFLHGMCTSDIRELHTGSIAYSLILTDHAHVVADLYVWADNDALYLEADRELWAKARQHLEKFLVADDVEMEELDDHVVLDILGPGAGRALAPVIAAAPELPLWRFVRSDAGLLANLPRIGLTGFTVIIRTDQAANFIERLISADPGIPEVSGAALEVLRVQRGLARVGLDATEKTIALEARLENAISFDKGCYLGQETVERATARGGVKKRLYGLRISSDRCPESGARVLLDGKEVGRLTSVAVSPRLGTLGLSILHYSVWQLGTMVTISDSAGEMQASVSDLPFD